MFFQKVSPTSLSILLWFIQDEPCAMVLHVSCMSVLYGWAQALCVTGACYCLGRPFTHSSFLNCCIAPGVNDVSVHSVTHTSYVLISLWGLRGCLLDSAFGGST